jgi:PadR family transcriptional regulator, regulatory protein PadR
MDSLSRITPATLDVLEALLTTEEDCYGLKIARDAKRKTGSVYPILARLEEAGWVESWWEHDERDERGPRRRFYRLSPSGIAATRMVLAERRTSSQRSGHSLAPEAKLGPLGRLLSRGAR